MTVKFAFIVNGQKRVETEIVESDGVCVRTLSLYNRVAEINLAGIEGLILVPGDELRIVCAKEE